MKFISYILKSTKTGKFYVGHTNDLARRFQEHNSGHTKSTRHGVPWEIVFTQEFDSNIDANNAELDIKKMKSRKFIEKLISLQHRQRSSSKYGITPTSYNFSIQK